MKTFEDLPKRWHRLVSLDDQTLASTLVTEPRREMNRTGPKPRAGRYPLPDHLIFLEQTHVGRPMATLCHAALIVLIRREIALDQALDRFFGLWEAQTDLLLASMSLRWMISAADTFADHGRTDAEKVAGLAAVVFATTLKLYETERHYLMDIPVAEGYRDENMPTFDLDGITPFNPDGGDTVSNMFKRKDRIVQQIGVAGRLLGGVMQRAGELDTVYGRFRPMQTGKGHRW